MPDSVADALRRYDAAERELEDASWALLEAVNARSGAPVVAPAEDSAWLHRAIACRAQPSQLDELGVRG